jgi:hypothetical protein
VCGVWCAVCGVRMGQLQSTPMAHPSPSSCHERNRARGSAPALAWHLCCVGALGWVLEHCVGPAAKHPPPHRLLQRLAAVVVQHDDFPPVPGRCHGGKPTTPRIRTWAHCTTDPPPPRSTFASQPWRTWRSLVAARDWRCPHTWCRCSGEWMPPTSCKSPASGRARIAKSGTHPHAPPAMCERRS